MKTITWSPRGDSLVDFSTYKLIMMSSGLDFIETSNTPEITFPCGTLATSERVLMIERARRYFHQPPPDSIQLGTEASVELFEDKAVVNGLAYDYCIDCTWGHLIPDDKFFFESTILLYYRKKGYHYSNARIHLCRWPPMFSLSH